MGNNEILGSHPHSHVNSTNSQNNNHRTMVSCPDKQHFAVKSHFFHTEKINREKNQEKYRKRPNGKIFFTNN